MKDPVPSYPLPNGILNSGDLCPKSWASPGVFTTPTETKGWGVCTDCGEVVRTDMYPPPGPRDIKRIPQHRIP